MLNLPQPPIRKADMWRHQCQAYHFARDKDASMLAMWMGTGKTKTTVDLVQNWGCGSILILCPKSVLGVWRREFSHWWVGDLSVLVLDKGTTAAKAKKLKAHLATAPMPVAVVVNYESARASALEKELLGRSWDVVILDESHRAKSHNSKISKLCWRLGQRARRRLCLTGTPMPNCPLDVFGQYRFLDSRIFGTSYHRFRMRYAILQQLPGISVPVVKGFQNQDDLKERFGTIAFSVDQSVLDLPEITHQQIECELSKQARTAYRYLEADLIAEIEGGHVTAANALVRLLRLQQCTSGWVPLDEQEDLVECDTSKRQALDDIVADLPADESVVVFGRFTSDLRNAERVAADHKREYREISGARKDLDDHGQMVEPRGQVLGVQIQSGGVGIDLTQARYAVFHSIGYSLGDFEQAIARLHRPGQRRHVHCYHLVANETIDAAIYKAIEAKRDIVESVMEVLKNVNG